MNDTKHTYYKIKGTYTDENTGGEKREVLFGSYDKSDCTYELEANKEQWKEEGYKLIKIESYEHTESPDPEVYGDSIDPKTGRIIDEDSDDTEEETTTSGEVTFSEHLDIPVSIKRDPVTGEYTIKYGEEVVSTHSTHEALLQLGSCIHHSLECAGKIDLQPVDANTCEYKKACWEI